MRDKIQALHLKRRAFVYVRQSTAMQVFANTESTARQYALVERAYALGWPENAVEVIDEDLGRSGATADDRNGFRRLAEAVAHGKAGACRKTFEVFSGGFIQTLPHSRKIQPCRPENLSSHAVFLTNDA